MTYELAKELKDAGFVLEHNYYDAEQFCIGCKKHILPDEPCTPTLSELIEACGDEFSSLHREKDGWIAFRMTYPVEAKYHPTPEEAVAKLWLALQRT